MICHVLLLPLGSGEFYFYNIRPVCYTPCLFIYYYFFFPPHRPIGRTYSLFTADGVNRVHGDCGWRRRESRLPLPPRSDRRVDMYFLISFARFSVFAEKYRRKIVVISLTSFPDRIGKKKDHANNKRISRIKSDAIFLDRFVLMRPPPLAPPTKRNYFGYRTYVSNKTYRKKFNERARTIVVIKWSEGNK